MLLTDEINGIKERVRESGVNLYFPEIDEIIDSYYIEYRKSAHLDSVITDYSSEFLLFKKCLESLWSDSKKMIFIKDVLSSIMKIKDDEESIIEAIQLYNYMM